MKKTIIQSCYDAVIKLYKESGITEMRIFADSIQFNEYTDSGMMTYLISNFDHSVHCGGNLFKINLNKPI